MDCSPPGSSVHEIFPGKDTGVGCHFLLQGIFPTQGSNPVLQADSLPTELQGKPYDRPRPCIKNKDITLLTKVYIIKAVVFPVVMYWCESWTIKKAEHQRIDAFELWCWRRLESPLACKEIKSVNPKGNQPWIFIGRTDAEAKSPILWPPDAKNWLIGKDPDAGEDWGQEKGKTENEIIGWHHQLNGYEFEKILRDSEGQGSLVYCSPWDPTESDTT